MIDLTKKGLPNTITVNGRPYSIYTDFRIWMRLYIQVQKLKKGQLLDVSYIFKNDHPQRIRIEDLLEFLSPPHELPRSIGRQTHTKVIDFELDSNLLVAAFWGQYGLDLTEVEDLHWHKFLALFEGLDKSTKLREVMECRTYEKVKDSFDPYERLRMAWEIAEEPDEEENDSFSAAFEVKEEGQTIS